MVLTSEFCSYEALTMFTCCLNVALVLLLLSTVACMFLSLTHQLLLLLQWVAKLQDKGDLEPWLRPED